MKIALIGYGKMGKMLETTAIGRGHEIVSIIDADNTDDFDSEAFRSAEVDNARSGLDGFSHEPVVAGGGHRVEVGVRQ